jgi:hypothetical protein
VNLRNLKAVSSYREPVKAWDPCGTIFGKDSIIGRWRLSASKKAQEIMVDDGNFDKFILSSICMNTIILGIETYYRNTEVKSLTMMNYAFTIIFGIEMLLRITAIGFRQYWRNPYYAFDGAIVVTGLLEVALTSISAFKNVTVMRVGRILRMLRVLRATKLAGHLTYFKRVMEVFKEAADEFGVVVLLLGLFVFIYSVMGMSLYGGELPIIQPFNFSAINKEHGFAKHVASASRRLSSEARRVSSEECDADCMRSMESVEDVIAYTIPGVFVSADLRANFDDFASAALVVFQVGAVGKWG